MPGAVRSRLERSTDDRLETREPHNRIERSHITSIRDFPRMFCMIIMLYYHSVHKCGARQGPLATSHPGNFRVPDRAMRLPGSASPWKIFFAAQWKAQFGHGRTDLDE